MCGKICARPGQLIEHLKTHNTEDRIKCFDCKFCSLDCKTLPKLKVHLENSHVDKAFKCDKCPKMYFSTKGYNTHKKTHGNQGKEGPSNEKENNTDNLIIRVVDQ